MPRASWSGFLRLSLVTCPVYLSPATSESKRIRFNQLNARTGNRVQQRLVDAKTGEDVARDQIVKGYEFDRDRYVRVTDEELKELQVESSKIVELDRFVGREEVDPLYLEAPYYVYPDGEIATETFRVIGEAMAGKHKVGLGRVTMSGRERLVLVEPRGGGLVMSTLRGSDEVRPAEFASSMGKVDPELIALAETIIERKSGAFEPASFHDRYQQALRELVDRKLKGEMVGAPQRVAEPPKVVNLMDALKRSLAQEDRAGARRLPAGSRQRPAKANGDRRQVSLLLPVSGGGGREQPATARRRNSKETALGNPAAAAARRKKA